MVHMWRSEDKVPESVFVLHCVHPEDRTYSVEASPLPLDLSLQLSATGFFVLFCLRQSLTVSCGWLRTCCVDEAGQKLTEIKVCTFMPSLRL